MRFLTYKTIVSDPKFLQHNKLETKCYHPYVKFRNTMAHYFCGFTRFLGIFKFFSWKTFPYASESRFFGAVFCKIFQNVLKIEILKKLCRFSSENFLKIAFFAKKHQKIDIFALKIALCPSRSSFFDPVFFKNAPKSLGNWMIKTIGLIYKQKILKIDIFGEKSHYFMVSQPKMSIFKIFFL